jgi:hypothetical protein
VRTANDVDGFVAALRAALSAPYDAAAAAARVDGESWDDKAALICNGILGLGLAFEARPTRHGKPAGLQIA